MQNNADTEALLALMSLAEPELVESISKIKKFAPERGVRFGDVLAQTDVSAFERSHGCALPVGYRLFLMLVGNGAVGSDRRWWEDLLSLPPTERSLHEGPQGFDLSEAFPLVDEWSKSNGGQYNPLTRTHDHTHSFASALFEAALAKGCLKIQGGSDPEGYRTVYYLVVQGEEPGSVWCLSAYYHGNENWEVSVISQDEFLSWYAANFENEVDDDDEDV